MPGFTGRFELFETFSNAKLIDFEGLNYSLKNIKEIIDAVGFVYPRLKEKYLNMFADRVFYEKIWQDVRSKILAGADKAGKDCHVFIHPFGAYFNNLYLD